MVRHIAFEDGVSWVARLRLPKMFGHYESLDEGGVLEVEVASPKPQPPSRQSIHAYNVDRMNEVGAPYILMDYIHGTVATELQRAKQCERGIFGTPNQDRNSREQMTKIKVQESSFVFGRIGSIYQNEKTSEFFIDPDVEAGKGPWKSSMDYYFDLSNHLLENCVHGVEYGIQSSTSFCIPSVFYHLISLYRQGLSIRDRLSLGNNDFGAHNLLVNHEFEIVGLIDLDGLMAAPIEVDAQYPTLTGLDREPLAMWRLDRRLRIASRS
ncbi:hypothetical protein N7492_003359 [Penicillium capsulatum]|uniref:Aminoglycoside phosphotransferase domain-containing protein n=1 Tax=Penicillium capsulatum TaxID=69766 RepID=A0A9W9IJF6_9EURO|nr:hypothetical protein N7492_003359 [Penicillium capsulatum]KAJ6122056.1 hypothetical protein N7512_004521 [Penicillium capsulatum]